MKVVMRCCVDGNSCKFLKKNNFKKLNESLILRVQKAEEHFLNGRKMWAIEIKSRESPLVNFLS